MCFESTVAFVTVCRYIQYTETEGIVEMIGIEKRNNVQFSTIIERN